jgi:RNA polymerase sigma-70 factor, ECF subfamily
LGERDEPQTGTHSGSTEEGAASKPAQTPADKQAPSNPADANEVLLRDMSGLKAQLTRVTRDADLASDLLQDAIVTALQKLEAGEIEHRGQLDGYVYRVALNHLRNHRRKDKSPVSGPDALSELVDTEGEARPGKTIARGQFSRVVTRLLKEMTSPRDREVLIRFYLQEEDRGALCRSLALTELQFNRVIFRARGRFRELLERRGYDKGDFLSIGLAL